MNNAGVSRAKPNQSFGEAVKTNLLTDAPIEDVRMVFDTNVFGVIAVTQAMLPLLREAPAGRIILTGSSGASLTLNSDPSNLHRRMFGNYSASKTAAHAVMLAFALALEDTNIKVNAACPGFTSTGLNNFDGTRTVEEGARAGPSRAHWRGWPDRHLLRRERFRSLVIDIHHNGPAMVSTSAGSGTRLAMSH